jgi:type II secretory ATPase GspE/PulE/Tfp pilus assembly ATPase PilB-like protein
MALADVELGQLLVTQSYLSPEDLVKAEDHAKAHELNLKAALFELGLLTQELLESAIAEHFQLPHLNVQTVEISTELLEFLPEDVAKALSAIVVERTETGVTIATSDPSRTELEAILRLNLGQASALFPETPEEQEKAKVKKGGLSLFGLGGSVAKREERTPYAGTISYVYAPQGAIDSLLVRYRKPLASRFQEIIREKAKAAPVLLEEIITDAFELHASDIHFEPQEKGVQVRFRVDGVLHEVGRLPKDQYEGVVNRIKIEGNMRIDEHYTAQDGALRIVRKGEAMDVRVSIVPVVDGEKVVMRVLSSYVKAITLTDLGFSEEQRKVIEHAAYQPFGMLITVGPTGAGKSTTLYALVRMRNHPDVNISTIEDPVEYKVQGVNHIQVNTKANLTFASGLRALVRQDPDIVLVGEIRDGETASISVNAALTGHLLFSTLHANDAATAVPRLLDMGVESYLVASTLRVVVAQRLVRRLCPRCRYTFTVSRAEGLRLFPLASAEIFPEEGRLLLYRGKGCEHCGGTGYRGRVGIYEVLQVTPEMETLIVRRASSTDINILARIQGMKLLFEDGFEKAKRGVTSLEELLRVSAPPEPLEELKQTDQARKIMEMVSSLSAKPTHTVKPTPKKTLKKHS